MQIASDTLDVCVWNLLQRVDYKYLYEKRL
jgi:hypothetical protein